jgi:hypothetical protein
VNRDMYPPELAEVLSVDYYGSSARDTADVYKPECVPLTAVRTG